ncbi:MAG: ferrous iron transport protein B [Verrucomicrobia bacterium GWF2_62_7]|nr:MAG: ferrous iron transport protein B [Verrucomicrobia bacterium GWF2_62_7]
MESAGKRAMRVALAGNPNGGKTTLFNALTGLRAHTANYPGTTIECRLGRCTNGASGIELLDLPGIYDFNASSEEEQVALNALQGRSAEFGAPDGVIVVTDATNLSRSLFLISQIVEMKLPVVVALNMVDLAEAGGIRIDARKLAAELGCPVVPVVARTGHGLAELRAALRQMKPPAPREVCGGCDGCRFKTRYAWSDAITQRCVEHAPRPASRWTERIDHMLTHPVLGVAAFFGVMLGLFFLIFSLASVPMDLIDGFFSHLGGWVERTMPESDLRNLLVKGVIGGGGGVLVFLPQICILFFCISLLEDTGYLARAAFVMDRLMRRVGLPGKAFVPMLSAHACAIPAIMATRVIEDKRDRLVTILVLPLFSCSARIPVYSMLAALLFADNAWRASLVFTGAYAVGILAAVGVAFALKRALLKGESRPLVLELPSYKMPSLRTAALLMLDRAWVFLRRAGTIILFISIALWALATYPKSEPPKEAVALQQQAGQLRARGATKDADEAQAQANRLTAHAALANSAAGRIGHYIEPVLRPLGFDWQIGIGIISSFAAREVIVSTLAVVYGVGEDVAEEDPESLYDSLRRAQRADGTKVFTPATCVSLLLFYVLAMQCLATQAITRRETNSWKWPALQLGYMTLLAYGTALVAFQTLRACGIA